MYERNAIVLERYFDETFKYNEHSNIKENYKNYCKLVDDLEKYNIATDNENFATREFETATENVRNVQKNGEKLYNKSAKLEYNRYIIYQNIEEESESISKSLSKIESDVEKNNTSLNDLDEEYKKCSDIYKEKKAIMEDAQRVNQDAKEVYEKSLKMTEDLFNDIKEEDILQVRDFLVSENKDRKKELNKVLIENGENEKIPFDPDVISKAVDVSFTIYTKEVDLLLNGYERTKKLLNEIDANDVKMDKHKKLIKDTTVKLNFLDAEKDYIVGFLDNERIAAIYDKKIHRKLMLESIRNLESDLVHINSMYDIILKEGLGRASKRLYKDNYNIKYLDEIQKTAENANQETNKLKTNSVAVMNLNYWRVDGITKIQDTFAKDMLNAYGRNLADIFPEKYAKFYEDLDGKVREQLKKLKKYTSSKEELKKFIAENLKDNKDKEDVKKAIKEEIDSVDVDSAELDAECEELFKKIDALDEELEEIEGVNDKEKEPEASNIDNDKSKPKKKSNYKRAKNKGKRAKNLKQTETSTLEEKSILDTYFSESNKQDEKRKSHDEKQLDKDTKSKALNKMMKINEKNRKSKVEA